MPKFRKRPVIIDAFRIGVDPIPDWFMDKVTDNTITLYSDAPDDCHIECRHLYKTWCEIQTLEGTMVGSYGSYIICGIKGECYPCDPDIFTQSYDPV